MRSVQSLLCASMGGLLVGLPGTTAMAQDQGVTVPQPQFDTRLYRLPIDSEATLWTNDAGTGPTGHAVARVGFHHTVNPLVFSPAAQPEVRILSSVSELQVVGGVHVGIMRLGVDLPVLVRVAGDQLAGVGGLGDLAFDAKAVALDRETTDVPIGLAGLVRVTVPSGTVDAAVATRGLGVEAEGIVDQKIGPVLVAGNIGHRYVPKAALGDLEWGSYGYGRLGAGWFIIEDAGLSVDVVGHLVYGIPSSTGVGQPAEGIFGGFGRISERLVLRGGVGTGLSGGVGAPDVRLIASLGYEPREVRDRDEDGIVDGMDVCPLEPEDMDRYNDTDGCPDPAQTVSLRVRNHLGESLPDGMMTVQTEYGTRDGGAQLTLEMHPGTYEVTGFSAQFADTAMGFTVVAGRNAAVDVDLEPLLGELRVIVQGPDSDYLPGEMIVDGGRPIGIMNGIGRSDLMAGEHAVVVQSDGYLPVSRAVVVRAGERENLEVVLTPAKVQLTAEKIEILDKVFFDVGRATIQVESHPLLDQVAGVLRENPTLTLVRVEGHTDARGSASANRQLSTLRAQSVVAYLVDRGVEAGRLEAVGFGPDRPLDPSQTSAAHDQNRRVEFVIVERTPVP